jgi:hypothetical protein
MTNTTVVRSLLAAALLTMTATACSNAEAGGSGASAREFSAVAARGIDVDYTALTSPADAVEKADLIVSGTLIEVTDGITFSGTDPAVRERDNSYVTFVVAVDKVLSGDASRVTDGRVHLVVFTSATTTSEQLAGLNPQADIVAVLADITDWRPTPDTTVVRPATIPAGAGLYAAYSDGLWVQGTADNQMYGISAAPDDLTSSWGGPDTVQEFAASIGEAVATN